MALQAAADELYGLPPEQFTAARDDFAKRLRQAGERELAAAVRDLRRPSVSAWLVNALVRRRASDLDALLDVGDRLRSAMTSGAGDEVRALTEQRRTAIASLVAAVEALAGRSVTPAVSEEVRLTLEAATADPTAATAVRSGRLVRSLRYAGFGVLPDLAGAVGLAPATQPPAKAPKSAKPAGRRSKDPAEAAAAAREQAERAAQDAAGTADDAQRAYQQRLAEEAGADAEVDAATEEVDAAARRLADAREVQKSAATATTKAREAARAAHAGAETARRRLADLRAEPKAKAKRRQ